MAKRPRREEPDAETVLQDVSVEAGTAPQHVRRSQDPSGAKKVEGDVVFPGEGRPNQSRRVSRTKK